MSKHVLFEIGVEELPARFIAAAEKQLQEKTAAWLQQEHIEYETLTTYSTPRRLAIVIEQIAPYQTSITEEVRGPQEKIAKDEAGNWTKAAIGFTKGQGKSVDDIYIKDVKGTAYIFVEKHSEGKRTEEVLPNFSNIVTSITFPQTMRWGSNSFRFARPIRWIVALLDDEVISFEVAYVQSGNETNGHRFLGKRTKLTNPLQYETVLEENYVIPNATKRKEEIELQMKQLEAQEDFTIEVDEGLLNEVTNLVEYPTVFFGSFDESYLELPAETLITSMQEHQRYFPVRHKESKKLLPYFVSVRNGDNRALENVVKGNEKVIRARLADAVFFYDEDRNHSINHFTEKLETVVFQEKLGTIYEKMQRVKTLAEKISDLLAIEKENRQHTLRAAEISKFDLVTNMVNEFPELQGKMGEIYALHYGEDEAVARAIKEHYLPIQANGELPESIAGAIVSIADKLDTIIGSISVGLIPTGSQDPYGLRRQALGIIRILEAKKWDIKLEDLVQLGLDLFEVRDESVQDEVRSFMKNRAIYILEEKGIEHDIVAAVLANEIGVIGYALEKAHILAEMKAANSFKSSQEAFVRILHLHDRSLETTVDPDLLETEAEKALYTQTQEVEKPFIEKMKSKDAKSALSELERLTASIHTFFDETMVMVEDEQLKQNRLALIRQLSLLIEQFADMTQVEWKQHH